MTARQRVIEGLGGRCAWCGSTADLEIDHIQGGGNAHRRALATTKMAYWVLSEYAKHGRWPTSVQVLCKSCHDRKSGRERRPMPARKGATAINVSLPDHLVSQLAVLAAGPEHHSKSDVMEAALRAYLEGGTQQTALDQVHQRLDTLTQAVKDLAQHLATPVPLPKALEDRLTLLEQQQRQQGTETMKLLEGLRTEIRSVYDTLSGRLEPTSKGWFSR
jgi:Arc/MetJ-type ribon-helix-helix transcriptional regulator